MRLKGTLLIAALSLGCNLEEEMQKAPEYNLPVSVKAPDVYIRGGDERYQYLLSESDEEGCVLVYRDSAKTVYYGAEECDNLNYYIRLHTNTDLETMVARGIVSGSAKEIAILNSMRITEEEKENIIGDYASRVNRIRDEHFGLLNGDGTPK